MLRIMKNLRARISRLEKRSDWVDISGESKIRKTDLLLKELIHIDYRENDLYEAKNNRTGESGYAQRSLLKDWKRMEDNLESNL